MLRLGLLLLLVAGEAGAAEYVVRTACTNNGDGTVETCAASGGAVGAYNVMSSITSTADGQIELARGNTVYLIGSSAAAWNPGGVNAGDGVSNFILRGDHALGAGGFDGGGAVGTLSALSGASRNNITFKNLYFRGSTSSCITTGTNTNILFDGITIPDGGCATHGIAINGGGNTIEIKNSLFGYVGPDANNTGGAIYAQPAASTTITTLLIHDNSFTGNNDFGRYGVGLYPPDTGTVTGAKIYDNTFAGSYSYMPITAQNDVDGTQIYDNEINVTAAQGGIHVGGQATTGDTGLIGDCPVTTDDTRVYDNIVVGTGPTTQGSGDDSGNGIYPDECSQRTIVERNEIHGNGLAGIYLNDSHSGVFSGNVVWGNGSNALNIHGKSNGNLFSGNTFDNLGATFGNGATQGRDAVQQDSTAGNTTANTIKNNAIVGDTAKCFDVDGSSSNVSESHNGVYGCPNLVEGFTQTSGVTSAPDFIGGSNPTTPEGFRPTDDSPLCAAGYYTPPIAGTYYDGQRFGQRPDIGALGCRSNATLP